MRNINLIGSVYLANEVLEYHSKYFYNFPYYDTVKKMFIKTKTSEEVNRFVYIKHLKGEINRLLEEGS